MLYLKESYDLDGLDSPHMVNVHGILHYSTVHARFSRGEF